MAGNCARMPRTASCPVGQGADAGLRIGLGARDCWEDGGVRQCVQEQAPYQPMFAPVHAATGRRASPSNTRVCLLWHIARTP